MDRPDERYMHRFLDIGELERREKLDRLLHEHVLGEADPLLGDHCGDECFVVGLLVSNGRIGGHGDKKEENEEERRRHEMFRKETLARRSASVVGRSAFGGVAEEEEDEANDESGLWSSANDTELCRMRETSNPPFSVPMLVSGRS